VLADSLTHLVPEELEEVTGTERGVVPPQLDARLPSALPALHTPSPIISPLVLSIISPLASP
jgi:hypothetical protein